jgi:hypothetical protein
LYGSIKRIQGKTKGTVEGEKSLSQFLISVSPRAVHMLSLYKNTLYWFSVYHRKNKKGNEIFLKLIYHIDNC